MPRRLEGRICVGFAWLLVIGFVTRLSMRLGEPAHMVWITCAIVLTILVSLWIGTTRSS
jgi:hypothetical protein